MLRKNLTTWLREIGSKVISFVIGRILGERGTKAEENIEGKYSNEYGRPGTRRLIMTMASSRNKMHNSMSTFIAKLQEEKYNSDFWDGRESKLRAYKDESENENK